MQLCKSQANGGLRSGVRHMVDALAPWQRVTLMDDSVVDNNGRK
jgi:hypothetical protein